MAELKFAERVQQTSATTGTGDYTLIAPATGFNPFSLIGANNYTYLTVTDGVNFERLIGTYITGPDRIQRTHVIESSNGGSAVNWGAGTRTLFIDQPARTAKPVRKATSVAGSSDVTLTALEQRCEILELTGVLTGNINVIVDVTPWRWTVYNNTSGSFALTVKTAAGSGKVVLQSAEAQVYCDGTNVRNALTHTTFDDGAAATPSVRVGGEQNGLFSPAANALGFGTAGVEAMRLDSSQRLIHGHTAAVSFAGTTPLIQEHVTAGGGLGIARWSADATGAIIFGAKSRSGTIENYTVVQTSDDFLSIRGYGSNGNGAFEIAGSIVFSASATAGAGNNDMPGVITLSTTANGASSVTEAVQIRENQSVRFKGIGTTASAANAFLDSGSDNNLLRSTSSLKYKHSVEGIERIRVDAFIAAAQPIWYRSRAAADNPDWSWYGLGAEDVAAIDPRLVHWGYPIISDQVEDVEVLTEVQELAVDTETKEIDGPPVIGRVERIVTKQVPVTKRARVVRRGTTLEPESVMYERVAVITLAKVQEHVATIAAQAAEIASLSGALAALTARVAALEGHRP